ncbi:hypothetical protein PIB30_062671 [Stylosanthes scabra]|uniref:Homeobox domain-containing protein n=1 Tax=Stylosanthes scabra TaxID=79078 RepID=A0ABU6TKY1_9FABA|nr:hypothetical protein [Stylosanthes scabra]
MNFDHHGISNNTSLQLGLALGIGLHEEKKEDDSSKKGNNHKNKAYPSLTLGPLISDDDEQQQQLQASKIVEDSSCSTPSPVSSFSNSSNIIIKKEKDHQFLVEEFEVEIDEKVPSSSRGLLSEIIDEDGNNTKRKKLRLTKEQSTILEESFKKHSNPNPKQKQELARQLNLRPRQVEVWFQNRRARTKLKQTESECELLKKCCETLTEENKRLQNELQQLKSSMQTSPLFSIQIPPPTSLTLCPSCDTINNNHNNGELLIINSKPHHNHHFHKNNNGYPLFKQSSSATC